MPIEILTKADLLDFKLELLHELRSMWGDIQSPTPRTSSEGLRTKEVRRLLDCSYGKLQTLRISGLIKYKKVGGSLYYNREDVEKLLREGFS